jgi:hypothetical protein
MIRALLTALACSAALPALALSLPAPLQKVTDAAVAECRDAGGAPSLQADYARAEDLNGDGVEDYLIDFVGLNCAGAESYFCGSAGCPVSVWVSTPGGYESAWSGPAQASRIDTATTPPGVVVSLHGQFCDPPRTGADGCEQRIALASVPTDPAPARPRPAGWTLREVPGSSPVAVSAGPAPIHDIALFCLSGAPFLAILPESPPPGTTLRVGFAFSGQTLTATARHEATAGGAYVIDLRETPLAQALAGRDSKTAITLDGAALGELSLAGSSKAIRGALASCLPL